MANTKRGKQATPAVTHKEPNWPLFVLALIGMALSGYLTFTAWQGKLVAFCTEGASCDVVLNSRWSTLFGMPTSFWGFLTYALLAAVATGFPRVFYLRYHGYAKFFPLWALARYRNLSNANARAVGFGM